jgi:nitrous oxidase accessory protein NosD
VVTACWLRKAHGDGIHIAGGPQADRASDGVIIRDTVVEQCGMYGLGCGRVANVHVESSRFERCSNGVKMFDCDDVVVHAVTAYANRRHGIVFLFSHRWHLGNCVTRGDGSEEDGGWGIAAGGDPSTNVIPNSDFTITSNISEDNVSGGITLDPTVPSQSDVIWPQRATISGNVCRNATQHHGIQVTHASDVVITGNVCSDNRRGSGIQVLSSSHVLVQGNICFGNRNGIGLFSNEVVNDPGYHVLGVNLLDRNDIEVRHQPIDQGQPLTGVRIHGLNGNTTPEGNVQAEPGTLFELHEDNQGALFVKEAGSETTGWRRVAASP